MQKVISLIVFLALVFLILLVGGWATGLYPQVWMKKVSNIFWGKPAFLIPPSWFFIYTLVAISGWLIWIKTESLERILPMVVYFGQLLLNGSWWWFFFYLKDPTIALIVLTVLSCLILFNFIVFWYYQKLAAVLLLPYFSWIVYATSFNWGLFIYGR